jgi:tetratricopeptide (TPR) repeat protein
MAQSRGPFFTMTLRRFLIAVVALEIAATATVVGLRLNSTAPAPPLVALYTDTLTSEELLALPGRYHFETQAKWRTLAETYAAFGYFAKADACYRRLAAMHFSPESAFHHGYCLVRLGRLDEGFAQFRQVIESHDSRFGPRAWYHLGAIHLRREQPQEALEAFERAGDDYLPAVYQRAKYLLRSEQVAAAAPLIEQLAEALPQDVKVWHLRAQAAAADSRPHDVALARDALDQAQTMLALDDIEDFFTGIRRRFGMGRDVAAASEQRDAGKARLAAERLTRLVHPETRWDNVYLYLMQDAAATQLQAGNLSAARELAVRQIETEKFPTPTVWQIRGEVDFSEQKWSQTVTSWAHAERLSPNAVDHIKLATAVEHLGDSVAAKRHLALAGLYSGIDLFREGNFSEARTMFQQTISIADDFGDLWYYLGECERRSDEPRAALAAYRRCLQLNPAHGRAAARLDELE